MSRSYRPGGHGFGRDRDDREYRDRGRIDSRDSRRYGDRDRDRDRSRERDRERGSYRGRYGEHPALDRPLGEYPALRDRDDRGNGPPGRRHYQHDRDVGERERHHDDRDSGGWRRRTPSPPPRRRSRSRSFSSSSSSRRPSAAIGALQRDSPVLPKELKISGQSAALSASLSRNDSAATRSPPEPGEATPTSSKPPLSARDIAEMHAKTRDIDNPSREPNRQPAPAEPAQWTRPAQANPPEQLAVRSTGQPASQAPLPSVHSTSSSQEDVAAESNERVESRDRYDAGRELQHRMATSSHVVPPITPFARPPGNAWRGGPPRAPRGGGGFPPRRNPLLEKPRDTRAQSEAGDGQLSRPNDRGPSDGRGEKTVPDQAKEEDPWASYQAEPKPAGKSEPASVWGSSTSTSPTDIQRQDAVRVPPVQRDAEMWPKDATSSQALGDSTSARPGSSGGFRGARREEEKSEGWGSSAPTSSWSNKESTSTSGWPSKGVAPNNSWANRDSTSAWGGKGPPAGSATPAGASQDTWGKSSPHSANSGASAKATGWGSGPGSAAADGPLPSHLRHNESGRPPFNPLKSQPKGPIAHPANAATIAQKVKDSAVKSEIQKADEKIAQLRAQRHGQLHTDYLQAAKAARKAMRELEVVEAELRAAELQRQARRDALRKYQDYLGGESMGGLASS